MWETWPPAALQETLLPWVMLARTPPGEQGSMDRNPAHGWINLTVVRSNERGKSVDNCGDIRKKNGVSDWDKRNKGRKELESEWPTVVIYSGETSLHLKKFVSSPCVRKVRDKERKKVSRKKKKPNNQMDKEMAGNGTGLAHSHWANRQPDSLTE